MLMIATVPSKLPTPRHMKHFVQACIASSLLLSSPVFASFEGTLSDARDTAMGESTVAAKGSPLAAFNNPASLPGHTTPGAACSFHVPFIKDITTLQGAISIPLGHNGVTGALSLERFGSGAYRESRIVISLASPVSSAIDAGISASRLSRSIQGFSEDATIGIDLGIQADLLENLRFGATIFNVNSPGIGSGNEKIHPRKEAGIAWNPSRQLLLTSSVEQLTPGNNLKLHYGTEYAVTGNLSLRMGLSSDPAVVSGGAGFSLGKLKAEAAVKKHPDLEDPAMSFTVSGYL